MDILGHALWGYVVFRKKALTKWAVLMTMMPDLLSFGIYLVILLFTGRLILGGSEFHTIPHYVTFMYNTTHSLLIAGMFGVFVYLKYRKYLVLVYGWMMHIGIDIFTHTDTFFPTHILYPVSYVHFSFIRWSDPWFMITNYSALIVVYSIMGYRYWKKKKIKNEV
jgi:hypothetical protein